MNIDKFIMDFKSCKNEEDFISSIVCVDYLDYEKKIAICNSIIKLTTYKDVDGELIYQQDTPSQHLLFTLNIINEYTKIDIDFKKSLTYFNRLNKNRLIDKIISHIPENEYKEFLVIFDMCKNDFYENNRNFVSYIDKKISSLKISSDIIIDSFNKYMNENI